MGTPQTTGTSLLLLCISDGISRLSTLVFVNGSLTLIFIGFPCPCPRLLLSRTVGFSRFFIGGEQGVCLDPPVSGDLENRYYQWCRLSQVRSLGSSSSLLKREFMFFPCFKGSCLMCSLSSLTPGHPILKRVTSK